MQSQVDRATGFQPVSEADVETWNQIAPLLDGAMGELGQKDHDALVLRFFENKTFAEVGTAVGASEDAAKMRVNRALEKLRKFFTKRGVPLSSVAIAGTISANSVQAAPVALAKAVTAVAIAKGSIATASTLTLIKGAWKIMAWTKIKTAVVTAAAVLLAAASVTPYVWHYHFSPNAWRHRFDTVYRLKDGEVIRYVKAPFISERLTFYRTDNPDQAKAIPRGPDFMVLRQDSNDLGGASMGFGFKPNPLRKILVNPLGFRLNEIDGDDTVLNLDLAGDWIIRADVGREELLKALEPVILKATGRKIHFTKQSVERDVIVSHGTAKDLTWQTPVQIYAEKPNGRGGGQGGGTLQQLLSLMGDQLGLNIVNEAKTAQPEPPDTVTFDWKYFPDANYSKMGNRRDELTDKVLKNVADQTGLTFTREKRFVDVWVVTEGD